MIDLSTTGVKRCPSLESVLRNAQVHHGLLGLSAFLPTRTSISSLLSLAGPSSAGQARTDRAANENDSHSKNWMQLSSAEVWEDRSQTERRHLGTMSCISLVIINRIRNGAIG